jgi:2TM domain-containing protein
LTSGGVGGRSPTGHRRVSVGSHLDAFAEGSAVYVPIQLILLVLWIATGAHFPWFAFPLLGWGVILAVHGVYAFVMKTPEEIMIERAAREQRTQVAP